MLVMLQASYFCIRTLSTSLFVFFCILMPENYKVTNTIFLCHVFAINFKLDMVGVDWFPHLCCFFAPPYFDKVPKEGQKIHDQNIKILTKYIQ